VRATRNILKGKGDLSRHAQSTHFDAAAVPTSILKKGKKGVSYQQQGTASQRASSMIKVSSLANIYYF
jgi:hypothetical protein